MSLRHPPETKPHRPWLILALLSSFMLINFWDRAAFGFAGTQIMRDLRVSHAEFGVLGGAFFSLFSVSALVAGRLGDRWSPRWIVASMASIWSLAQALMSLSSGFAQALASRILLGAGEGPAFPTALHIAYAHFPAHRRATITAVVSLGVPVGIASGAVLITWAVDAFGWRMAFALLCAVSAIWSLAWIGTRQRSSASVTTGARPSTWLESVHFNSTALGVMVAAFGVYWVLALAVNWIPASLQAVSRLSPAKTGWLLAAAWALQALVFPPAAWLCEWLRRRGNNAEIALAVPASCGVGIAGLAMTAFSSATPPPLALGLVSLCLCATAVSITCLPPIVAEVTPSRDRGTALGVFTAFSSTAGVIAPIVFGRIVDVAQSVENGYRAALWSSGLLLIALAGIALFLMRPTRHRVRELGDDPAPVAPL